MTFENIKTVLLGLAGIVIVGLILHSGSVMSLNESYKSKIEADALGLKYVKNKWDEEIATRKVAELDKQTFKDLYDKDLTYIKSHLGISKNDVQGIITAAFKGHYEDSSRNVQPVVVHDTIHNTTSTGYIGHDSTKWLNITATITPGLFKYRVNTFDSVLFVPHMVSNGFLKPKRLFVSGQNFNPNSRISGLNWTEVHDYKVKHFVLSAGISAGYTDHLIILPAIHLGYKLLEF